MRVLLVEDDPAIASLLERYLTRFQHQVRAFDDSFQALQQFAIDPHAYDIAVTDLSLEGLSGEELVVELLNKRPELPIIIATGYPYSTDHLPENVRKQVRILQKPFLPRELMEVLSKI